jgi:hypothetical protein
VLPWAIHALDLTEFAFTLALVSSYKSLLLTVRSIGLNVAFSCTRCLFFRSFVYGGWYVIVCFRVRALMISNAAFMCGCAVVFILKIRP